MKIIKFISQYRRDFRADFQCEGCGYIEKNKSGYDDENFHKNVIPTLKCPNCGKSGIDLGVEYRPFATKYPEGMQL